MSKLFSLNSKIMNCNNCADIGCDKCGGKKKKKEEGVTQKLKMPMSLNEFVAECEDIGKGRCWDGYELTPGKKAYTNNSCRKTGSGKKRRKGKKKKKR